MEIYSKSSEEYYVAVRSHILSECGRALQRILEEIKTLGKCVIADGLKDALSIAEEASGRMLVLLGCRESELREVRVEVSIVDPIEPTLKGWEDVREDLWLGLSGDVSIDGVVGALRVFVKNPFVAIAVSSGREEEALELALSALRNICLSESTQNNAIE